TLATIASNTAFTASPAATLLRLPAFAATWTRSDLVTTCDIVSLPLRACVFELALIVSKPNWKDNQLAHAAAQSNYDYAQRRIHHAAIAHACAGGARCRRARDHSPGTRPDHTHLLELGAADAPPDDLAGELGRRSRESHRRARQVPVAAQGTRGAARNLRCRARWSGRPLLCN